MGNNRTLKKTLKAIVRHKVFTLIIFLLVMVAVFSIWSDARGGRFLQAATLSTVLTMILLSSFLAMGAGCLLITGNLDLSLAAIGALGGMILAAGVQNWGIPTVPAIILSLVCCGLLGAFNATMVTKFKFPAFIATFGMMSMSRGLMFWISSLGNPTGNANTVAVPNNALLKFLGQYKLAEIKIGESALVIPVGVVIMLLFFLFYGILISKSKFGMKMMMSGGNPTAAKLAGINSDRIAYIMFINAAVLGGIAGMFNTGALGQGSLLALQKDQYTGITAAILGGVSFGGGSGGMGGVLIGLLILMTFQLGMSSVGVNPFWINVFSGVVLILALTMDFFTQKRAASVKAS